MRRWKGSGGLAPAAFVMAGWMLAAAGQAQEAAPPIPAGKVIVSSDHPPVVVSESSSSVPENQQAPPDVPPGRAVTDFERASIAITAWDLTLHLEPAGARAEAQARLRIRNVSAAPLARIALQLSSTLRWQTVSGAGFTQSPVATDADHTGYAEEVVITLQAPLAPGAEMPLSVTYAGEIRQSAARLEGLGTPPEQAAAADWDAIEPTLDAHATALRGFGHVLWYPVASPVALLGEGNRLVELLARQRQLGAAATMRLRLTVDYTGDPPDGAIFNGHLQSFEKTVDDPDTLVNDARGLATTEFAEAPLGVRVPSLFLTAQQPQTNAEQTLSIVSPRTERAEPYRAAADLVQPLLTAWFGPAPTAPLLLLDHPGETYADGALLVAQLAANAQAQDIAPGLVGSLTHAALRIGGAADAWLDQGMAEFMGLLWLERISGRDAALSELRHAALLIGLAEPDLTAGAAEGQPLTSARDDVYLRLKSAYVLWQLREILGEPAFREAMLVFRHSLTTTPELGKDRQAFEHSLERTTGKDLAWFFGDWVYRDRSLPDLTLVSVNPRALPARPGKNGGYLVAVEVRNDGDATAEVPVTVRSGGLTSTERLRIAGRSSASTRILFESTPETVDVNDGSVPELRTSSHTTTVRVAP